MVDDLTLRARRLTTHAAAVLALLVGFAASGGGAPAAGNGVAVPIQGGVFEASGVAAVPGGEGVLFVDDGTADAVFWMQIDASGGQVGDVVRVPLGVAVTDPEGITTDGTRFYVVGSQSKKEGRDGAGLVRFTFDAEAKRAADVERIDGLGALLVSKAPELARLAKRDGLNIEGLAWDARAGRLLLGLRSPLAGSDAVVVPLEVGDGPLSAASVTVAGGVIRVGLGGMGIRSLEAGADGEILVVAGATDKEKRVDFSLWSWSGEAGAAPRRTATLDRDLKPEGVARVESGGVARTIVVCDVSKLLAMGPDAGR
jgi:hypothetical protein